MKKPLKGYAYGWVACIRCRNGRFSNGREYLYSEPHPTEQQARDWAYAFKDEADLIRVERNEVPIGRLVKPLERESQ